MCKAYSMYTSKPVFFKTGFDIVQLLACGISRKLDMGIM